MRNVAQILCLLIAATLLSLSGRAGHISGLNVEYTCLGGNQYLVSVNLFHDCGDSQEVPDEISVFIGSSCGTSQYMPFPKTSEQEVSQLCEDQLPFSTCNGGFQPGVEMATYELEVTLEPCSDWKIIVAEQNRDGTTANLINPATFNIHVEAELDNSSGDCNTSPQLSVLNLPYVCVNSNLLYNLGFVDSDGDSLSYALVTAQASMTPLSPFDLAYTAGLSGMEPIDGITIDPVTGQIEVLPSMLGRFNIVVQVKEYRNGVEIGTIHYDFLMIVIDCVFPPPEPDVESLSHVSGGSYPLEPATIGLCPEDEFCFSIDFTSADPDVNVALSSNISNLIPGTTEIISGSNPASITFCGTLPPGFTGGNFLISAIDDACPVYGQSYYPIELVMRSDINLIGGGTYCQGDWVDLTAENDTVYTWYGPDDNLLSVPDQATCNPCRDTQILPDTTGWYKVVGSYENSSCSHVDSVFIEIPLNAETSTALETCLGNDGAIGIDVLTGSGNYQVTWSDIGVGPLNRTGMQSGFYTAVVEDLANGCSKTFEFDLGQIQIPEADAGSDTDVCGQAHTLSAVPSVGDGYWTSVTTGSFIDSTEPTTVVAVSGTGNYQFVWTEDAGGGCLDRDTVLIQFYDDPDPSISLVDSICGLEADAEGSVQLGTFSWSSSDGLMISDPNAANTTVIAPAYGTFTVELIATNGACQTVEDHEVTFVNTPSVSAGPDFSVCGLQTTIVGSEDFGQAYWEFPAGLATSDPLENPSVELNSSGYGLYEVVRHAEENGLCAASDTVEVRFVEQPSVYIGEDGSYCTDQIEINGTTPIGNLTWEIPAGASLSETDALPTQFSSGFGLNTVILHADNGYGCIDSDTLQLHFIEQPIAEPTVVDTVCDYEMALNAGNTADLGYWVNDEDLSFANDSDPETVATVVADGTYHFGWVLENGGMCRDTSFYEITFYEQPQANAGSDMVICGLTHQLDATPSVGQLLWIDSPGLTFSNPTASAATIQADWYGAYTVELIEQNGICVDQDFVEIEFHSAPQILTPSWDCTGADAAFILTFDLGFGDTANYALEGPAGSLNSLSFTSDPILSDTPVEVVLADGGICGNDTLEGSLFCPVLSFAGTMSQDTLIICEGESALAAIPSDFTLDANDTLLFVLHENQGLNLGDIYQWNSTPTFGLQPGMEYNQVYYISSVVGTVAGDAIDLSDPLLSIAEGTPVVYREAPEASISGDMLVCPNVESAISVNVEGDFPLTLTFESPTGTQSVDVNNPGFEISVPDSGVFELIGIQDGYCPGDVDGIVRVEYFELPTAELSGEAEICAGDTSILMLAFSGVPDFDYELWLNGEFYSGGESSAAVSQSIYSAGEYELVHLSDANCLADDTSSFYLTVKPLPQLDLGEDLTLCSGDTVMLETNFFPGQSYQWTDTDGLFMTNLNQASFTQTNILPFPDYYTIYIESELNECTNTDSVEIVLSSAPTPFIFGPDEYCSSDSISLIGTGGQCHWEPAQYFSHPDSTNTLFWAPADQVVTLLVESDYGCANEISRQMTIHASPTAYFDPVLESGCAPVELLLHADDPLETNQYAWNVTGAGKLISQGEMAIVQFDDAGSYDISLTVTSQNGCTSGYTTTQPIAVFKTYAEFELVTELPTVSSPQAYFQNNSPTNVSSTWYVDTLGEHHSRHLFYAFPEIGGEEYEVCLEVVDEHGCIDRFCDLVKVKDDFYLYVPNSFTPNGDGLNDLFYPVISFVDVREYHFWINDRRGEIVFETNDPNAKWDGTAEGEPYFGRNQAYTWHLVIKPEYNTETQYYNGHVNLIR